jgi:hypothetical protein
VTNVVASGKGIYRDNEMRGAVLYAKLIGALSDGVSKSYVELAEYTGLHEHTVRRYLMALREHKPRLARISDWSEDIRGNPSIRCFQMGSKPDEKRPKMSNAERQTRQRIKKRQKRHLQMMSGALPQESAHEADAR